MESSLMLFMYKYLQGCVRFCSPERRKNRAKWVSLCQLSVAKAQWWISLGREVGGGLRSSYYCCGAWALHQTKQQQCPAFPPSLPPSVHRHVRCCSLRCYAPLRSWLFSSFLLFVCLLLSASPLSFYLCLPILKNYLGESFPLKPFEFLKSLMFDIVLDGNTPFTAVLNEGCQLNLPVLSNQIFKHPSSTALSLDNLCLNIKNRNPVYIFVRDIKSVKEQQWITGIVNKADVIFRDF